ncbi:MAG: endosialidase [Mobilitalea sp.]|jgi:hypothetical protein
MAVVKDLIREESDGTISFGNYTLDVKSKVSDFEHEGDLYKIKTFNEITKLEKNGMFVYESVPGTAVFHFDTRDNEISFDVTGTDTAQITLELEAEKEYEVFKNNAFLDKMKTNVGGKLVVSLELGENIHDNIKVVKL